MNDIEMIQAEARPAEAHNKPSVKPSKPNGNAGKKKPAPRAAKANTTANKPSGQKKPDQNSSTTKKAAAAVPKKPVAEPGPGENNNTSAPIDQKGKRPYRVAPWVKKRMEAQAKKAEAVSAAPKDGGEHKAGQADRKPAEKKSVSKGANARAKQTPAHLPEKKGPAEYQGGGKRDSQTLARKQAPRTPDVPAQGKPGRKKPGEKTNDGVRGKKPAPYTRYPDAQPVQNEKDGIFEDKRVPNRSYWNGLQDNEIRRANALLDLEYAVSNKVIKQGVITGVAPLGVFKDHCAIVSTPDYQVYIPFNEMFCDGPLEQAEGETEESLRRRQEQLLINSIGANIHYTIQRTFETADKKNVFGIASRREAMLRDQQRYYQKDAAHEHPYIVEGGIYEADIIGVGNHGIRVCLYGVDTQMWVAAISYRWIENAKHVFKPGDKIRVCVRSIKKRENGVGLDVELSGKDVENRERRANAAKLTPGGVYTAHVTRIKASSLGRSASVQVFIDGYNVPAVSVMSSISGGFRTIRPGALVALRVSKINQEDGKVSGTITQVIQRGGVSNSGSYVD